MKRQVYQEKTSRKFFTKINQVPTLVDQPNEAQTAHITPSIRQDHLHLLSVQFPNTEWEIAEVEEEYTGWEEELKIKTAPNWLKIATQFYISTTPAQIEAARQNYIDACTEQDKIDNENRTALPQLNIVDKFESFVDWICEEPDWADCSEVEEAREAIAAAKAGGITGEEEKPYTISLVWSVEDVLKQAEEDGVECTHEQAVEVLNAIDMKHDATVGVNWDVISYWISEVCEKAEEDSE